LIGSGRYARPLILRGTGKVLDLLGGRAATLADVSPTDDDWYVNLL
jgi:hypothetical protein